MSIHDYIATTKEWVQLWADDNIAYWFESIDEAHSIKQLGEGGYRYLVNETTEQGTFKSWYCKDLTQAFSVWNNLINDHLKGAK